MISIVCVYNDEDILQDYLLKGLEEQTVEFELIKINNTEGVFKSAAAALNCGGIKAKGDYIMFVHQDVRILGAYWLEKAEKYLKSINDLGIAGVAGMSKLGNTDKERGRNIIFHGDNKKLWERGNPISEPTEVQTLDEQLLIISKKLFSSLKFNETCCSGWHLYGVNYALDVRSLDLKAYVVPLQVWHKSTGGPLNKDYFSSLRKICKRHNNIKEIYTTCGDWSNNLYYLCLYWLEFDRRLPIIARVAKKLRRITKKKSFIKEI